MSRPGEGPGLSVAPATAEELMDLRWAVLRVGRPRHTAAMPGDDAADTRHWALREHGVIQACVTVMVQPYPDDPDDRPASAPALRLRGMAVQAGQQGRGLGGHLLEAVQAEVAAPMWCDARLRAVPFYAAHGWEVRTGVYDVPNVGPHHRMCWPGPR
ncbi:MAG: GNAT family N-acetyltransferase [Alphaproteobacteria bacterium]|nr:GNAT family N-acetyltransferase [Alphaproteobacteria bacterium]